MNPAAVEHLPPFIALPGATDWFLVAAGFGQIEAQAKKVGMLGEVACMSKPWRIIPMVMTEVQDVIAAGQIKPTDQLFDMDEVRPGGTITVIVEPLFEGGLDSLPQWAICYANTYTSNHDRLEDENLGAGQRAAPHAVNAVGPIHALMSRIQAIFLPVQTLVLRRH